MKIIHSEELQDLQSDLNLKHQTEKTRLLRDLGTSSYSSVQITVMGGD